MKERQKVPQIDLIFSSCVDCALPTVATLFFFWVKNKPLMGSIKCHAKYKNRCSAQSTNLWTSSSPAPTCLATRQSRCPLVWVGVLSVEFISADNITYVCCSVEWAWDDSENTRLCQKDFMDLCVYILIADLTAL